MAFKYRGFLDRISALYSAGDLDSIAAFCVVPLRVYIDRRFMVLGSRSVIAEALGLMRDKLTEHAFSRVKIEIDAVTLPVDGQQSIYLTWVHIDKAEQVIGNVSVRYVVEVPQDGGDPVVHAAHYIETDFDDVIAQMPFETLE